ncbi:hypothetical protein AX15_004070 [Amanita polypyramis BW_CC]|nr:hypothetical protein AX15_004070 [Amanita polypyramis BW_CC]
MFIVIDAIDECEDLAQPLPILTDLAVEINVFATSHADIRSEFANHRKLDIGRDDIYDDVGHFIETDVRRIIIRDPKLVQERLILGAQGT